jgi:tRNA A58 N-methylase Trm61
MLNAPRRWALRELKVHPGQTVVVAGCPPSWTLSVLRKLVTDTGAVLVVEADAERAASAVALIDAEQWSNVAVVAERFAEADLPMRADRVLVDNDDALADPKVLARAVGLLGPAGRVAVVCRRQRGESLWLRLEDLVPGTRREPFYFGAAFAVWAQVP